MWQDKQFEWGKQYFSCDYNQLSMALYNHDKFKVIVLDDDAQKYKRIGCYMMSLLLPPYQAVEAEINGDFNVAIAIYNQYLESIQCSTVFGAITRALYSGINVLIFISPDEAKNLSFAETLIKFMYTHLGFPSSNLLDPNPPCGILNMDPIIVSNRMDIMYAFGYIPFDDYCDNHPDVIPLDLACARIAHDIQAPELLQLSQDDRMKACGDIVISNRNQRLEIFKQTGGNLNNLAPCPVVELHDFQRRVEPK